MLQVSSIIEEGKFKYLEKGEELLRYTFYDSCTVRKTYATTITPPSANHDFNRLIKNSTLRFIDQCYPAPMMEQPEQYNEILDEFLNQTVPV